MKKVIETIKNIYNNKELRQRILVTLGLVLVYRIGSFIVLPGVDPKSLTISNNGIAGFIDMFLGGAFSKASILGLGIMPYITASIVLQLLGFAVPYFQKLQKEGESGRRKINQYTRVLTILICIGQSFAYLSLIKTTSKAALFIPESQFVIISLFILTAGTIFSMWLGEKITERGIGNGISILITVGIMARFPSAMLAEFYEASPIRFILEMLAFFGIIAGMVMFSLAVRRIPVQYARQMASNAQGGGRREFLSFKVNSSGVMPIIFGQSLLFIPPMIASIWASTSERAASIQKSLQDPFQWPYNALFALLILVFTFFYTAIMINPIQIADDLKRNNGFIPGIKPGLPTSNFIDEVISRITLPSALFLALIAVLPAFVALAGVGKENGFALFFGGTSLLIMVGVVLDTADQINDHLMKQGYSNYKVNKLKRRGQELVV